MSVTSPCNVTLAKLAQDLGILGHLWSAHDAITSWLMLISIWLLLYIHIGHIKSVWAIGVLSQGHMGELLLCNTGQVVSRFGKESESLVSLQEFHNSIMSCLKLIFTSECFIYSYIHIKNIQNVWTIDILLSQGHVGAPLYQTLHHRPSWYQFCERIRVTHGVEMMSLCHGWGWFSPQNASYIHIWYIQSVWAISMQSYRHMAAPLLLHWSSWPQIWDFRSLVEWNWCHYLMFEADIQLRLRPLHTSILDIYKEFETLVCCLKGTWVHPYPYYSTRAKLAKDRGKSGSLVEWNWYNFVMFEADSHIRLLHTSMFVTMPPLKRFNRFSKKIEII